MTNSLKLLEPIALGSIQLRNRVVMAPMTRARAGESRLPNELMSEYYTQRASAGLIVTEATTVSRQANGWNQSPGIYTDEMTEAWRMVVDDVHAMGGTIFLQLWHCGRASHSRFHDGQPAVAPSPIRIHGDSIQTPKGNEPYETPRELRTEELAGVVDEYRQATARAMRAGFDGVEIHSANGYLLDTFLQSKTNHRTDDYGGSLENRFRMLHDVVAAVADACTPGRVGVRISPNGIYNDMGSPDFREQFTYVAEQLDNFNLAYLHVIDGLSLGFHDLGEPMTLAEFRKVFHGPLIGNSGYTLESAEQRVSEGDADLIAFGRPYIANPDLVERFTYGLPLSPEADRDVWYSHSGAAGYTDFPNASPVA